MFVNTIGRIQISSPFDYAKSVTHTKESLYTNEHVFNKEYESFIVNRSLSNSPQTALFAEVMGRYPFLDKRLQYDFYMYGLPKQKGYTKWIKKEKDDVSFDHQKHISETLNVSMSRAIELYKIIGPDAVKKNIDSRGGKK